MNYPHTWAGKGLRLIDLLTQDERRQIVNFLSSDRQFAARHVKADASEFLRNAYKHGVLGEDEYHDMTRRPANESTLHGVGYSVVTAMDGRLKVQSNGEPPPLRGDIPPGSRSKDKIAQDFLLSLQAEGIRPEFPQTYEPRKYVSVSREFAEYLRANDEFVKAFARDHDNDVTSIWCARSDQDVSKAVMNFHLATLGANAPDGGALAKVIEAKSPRPYAAWAAGLADEWRMMDSLRDIILDGARDMTAGAYTTTEAGGELTNALSAFQASYRMLAEDAMSREPRRETAERLIDVGTHLRTVGVYLDSAPIVETRVRLLVTDAVDMAAHIADDILHLCAKNERERSRSLNGDINLGIA